MLATRAGTRHHVVPTMDAGSAERSNTISWARGGRNGRRAVGRERGARAGLQSPPVPRGILHDQARLVAEAPRAQFVQAESHGGGLFVEVPAVPDDGLGGHRLDPGYRAWLALRLRLRREAASERTWTVAERAQRGRVRGASIMRLMAMHGEADAEKHRSGRHVTSSL